ncbi:hypothetical protein EON64_10300 [archaeon]|nr:MAG: hypothetical protein EON64_10300 [archaeon]
MSTRPFYQEVKLGKSYFLPLEVQAAPPPAYQWFRNGFPLPNQTARELAIEEAEAADSGTYSCRVRNIAGEVLWLEATIAVVL